MREGRHRRGNSPTSITNPPSIPKGNYSTILAYHEKLFEETGHELEAYYLVSGRFAVLAGVLFTQFEKRTLELLREHPEVEVRRSASHATHSLISV